MANPVLAAPAGDQAAQLTQALAAQQKRFEQAQGADRSAQQQRLLDLANERNETLRELMERDPAAVSRVAIPEDRRQGMPAEVREMLLQNLELEGELEVLVEDDLENFGHGRVRQFLNTSYGEKLELHIPGNTSNLQSGQQVRLNGFLLNGYDDEEGTSGDVALTDSEDILSLAATSGASYGSEPGALPYTMDEQRTLVIMVNFQDDTSQPWTRSAMSSLLNGQVSDYYREVSYGQTWINASVTNWYTLPLSSNNCNRTDLTHYADQAATSAGYNLNSYDRLIYAFPRNACGWSGLGSVGGLPSRTWINGSFSWNVYAHELGHNLGLYHAHDLDCGSATLGSNCSVTEYGDIADLMGAGSGHFNAYEKDRLGWFGSSMLTVTSSGDYSLAPHEFDSNQPLALKVLKETDSSTGKNTWYYMEYRRAIGLDSFLSFYSSGNLHTAVSIHTGADSYGNTSYLLDMTPGTAGWYDAALAAGKSYSDSSAGVSIATLSANSSEAVVRVTTAGGGATCTRRNPALGISPDSSDWVAAGTTVTYTVTVTNRDSSACANTGFNLSATKPNGWSATFTNSSLSLAPGASATTSLKVTSATTATDGFYDIPVTAASGGYSASVTATYVVDNPVTTSNSSPVAVNDSASTTENTAVTINVLSNDYDPDGDSLAITQLSGVNGSAVINGNNTITFTPSSGYSGVEYFQYTIDDGRGGADSAQVAVTVNKSTTSNNNAPVAVNDSATTTKGGSVTIAVLANDYDPDGDSLTVSAVSQGTKGTVTINANGTLTYYAKNSFKDWDSFSYTISDGSLTDTAVVYISASAGTSTKGGGNKGANGKGPNK